MNAKRKRTLNNNAIALCVVFLLRTKYQAYYLFLDYMNFLYLLLILLTPPHPLLIEQCKTNYSKWFENNMLNYQAACLLCITNCITNLFVCTYYADLYNIFVYIFFMVFRSISLFCFFSYMWAFFIQSFFLSFFLLYFFSFFSFYVSFCLFCFQYSFSFSLLCLLCCRLLYCRHPSIYPYIHPYIHPSIHPTIQKRNTILNAARLHTSFIFLSILILFVRVLLAVLHYSLFDSLWFSLFHYFTLLCLFHAYILHIIPTIYTTILRTIQSKRSHCIWVCLCQVY